VANPATILQKFADVLALPITAEMQNMASVQAKEISKHDIWMEWLYLSVW